MSFVIIFRIYYDESIEWSALVDERTICLVLEQGKVYVHRSSLIFDWRLQWRTVFAIHAV